MSSKSDLSPLPTSYREAKDFVDFTLPQVSRTFALNIKVLKGDDYDFVACSYLICRTIDTIEDSPHTPAQKKVSYLKEFQKVFKKSFQPQEYLPLIAKIIPVADNPQEKALLEQFHWVMYLYNLLPSEVKEIGLEPILEMAKGMAGFIEKYAGKKEIVLKNDQEMEQYCYYVAGTVGNLLTNLFEMRIKSIIKPSSNSTKLNASIDELIKRKNDFGLGLQMTNIAKDFQRDGKRGWTYIPESYLKDEKISRKDFLSGVSKGEVAQKTKNIHLRFVNKAVDNLDSSLLYTSAIPRKFYQYRLFCFIPLYLAVKTSSFIKKQTTDSNFKDKISRKNVYQIIFFSYLAASSNLIAKFLYNQLKK